MFKTYLNNKILIMLIEAILEAYYCNSNNFHTFKDWCSYYKHYFNENNNNKVLPIAVYRIKSKILESINVYGIPLHDIMNKLFYFFENYDNLNNLIDIATLNIEIRKISNIYN